MGVNTHHKHIYKKTKRPKSPIDNLVYGAVIFGPIMTIPQVYTIWVQGSRGVSAISWAAYLITSVVWLAYGLHHKLKPIIALQSMWIVLDILILVGLARTR